MRGLDNLDEEHGIRTKESRVLRELWRGGWGVYCISTKASTFIYFHSKYPTYSTYSTYSTLQDLPLESSGH